ncbi:MAG: hypothetical protein HGA27_06825 [Peptococcaceae bacterium]|nr:hypothetical protein [Peptococcaceae bacterium]
MKDKNDREIPAKIKIGRLAVDPVFLMISLFFIFSSLSILVFILVQSESP